MKALTVRQPWADAIAHGPKHTENRTRRTTYRGPLLIHAGLAEDRNALPPLLTEGWPDERGYVVATAQLVGCHRADGQCCGNWGFLGCWHWELADVQALTAPVPAKGQLGLWNPTAELLAAIADQPCPVCDGTGGDHQIGCPR